MTVAIGKMTLVEALSFLGSTVSEVEQNVAPYIDEALANLRKAESDPNIDLAKSCLIAVALTHLTGEPTTVGLQFCGNSSFRGIPVTPQVQQVIKNFDEGKYGR